ncbi:hypothetical protein HYL88_004633 [Salmonella enterica subsp. enterica serovar Infantis]|uniref:hypothetical protein n=1 Tax=Salmonella enterica TaxID=28901 RepID=UPI00190DF17E|nr:hypothetical protein [Salmonella enterica]EFR5313973.1 hypothetical protein [Salmonella enterica subsp. enterica serovar Typhimurium]EFR5223077.1 hypothetical protein [Salmonella enterica subsp. enterica serovar Infantis]EFR5271526.1 hypothetical protein [Salmonella enterica subsp. enterica serovar Infantis]EFR5276540.1 hypothetical protein [Salmonella enterica subsp. enterica serovar Infantis]EFR5335940.1 hypothetical protein [Salmonella enterica subsp. enterica serovar Infantis]
MLKSSEINYPITFHFTDSRGSITYNSSDSKGVWRSGGVSMYSINTFVDRHNKYNEYNNPDFDYYYEMAEHKSVKASVPGDNEKYFINKGMLVDGHLNFKGDAFYASAFNPDYRIYKIEDMPVGATLLGVQRENGEWDELKFKPRRIEVHDDVICLLSGYSGGYKRGNNYGAEINIKIGTNVKIKNSTFC